MIRKFIHWFFSSYEEPVTNDVYSKLIELQERIEALEAENVENSNCFYELHSHIDAVDARIDIITAENWSDGNVRGLK